MLGALRAACDEMGAILVRSAHSANIKERRDASTALFDARGEMAMQAEHIPVHLGAMPAAVEAVVDERHAPGDAWILNDPFRGGTHLPDVTVISPIFCAAELTDRVGLDALREGMSETNAYAERRTRAALAELEDGERGARDVLEAADGDLELCLRATVARDSLTLDFSGSASQHEGNLNCPLAVTRSACIFALRVLADPDVPPCAGAHRPLEVLVPEGTMLNARPGAAVVAGDVATSSRAVDPVPSAFGRACGQGTMNNLTLGNDGFTYYETLGGGQGACPDADGPSAVHVAMSNTLNTPVEALELEFPLRAAEYAVRRGSGGDGKT